MPLKSLFQNFSVKFETPFLYSSAWWPHFSLIRLSFVIGTLSGDRYWQEMQQERFSASLKYRDKNLPCDNTNKKTYNFSQNQNKQQTITNKKTYNFSHNQNKQQTITNKKTYNISKNQNNNYTDATTRIFTTFARTRNTLYYLQFLQSEMDLKITPTMARKLLLRTKLCIYPTLNELVYCNL